MEVWSLEKAGMGDDDWLMCDDGLMYNSRQINTVYGRLVQNERRVDGLMYTSNLPRQINTVYGTVGTKRTTCSL